MNKLSIKESIEYNILVWKFLLTDKQSNRLNELVIKKYKLIDKKY